MSESLLVAPPPLFTLADHLSQARLEQAADQLLHAGSTPPPPAYPYHRECRLQELRRREQRVVAPPDPARPGEAARRQVLLRLVGRIPLSPRQRLVFRLAARGYRRAQIADRLGVTPHWVSHLYRETCQALAAQVTSEDRDLLLPPRLAVQETYRAEVARRGYIREKHCAAGHEDCRRTGVCTRRWYLYFAAQEPAEGG